MQVHGTHAKTLSQRWATTIAHGVAVAAAAWILFSVDIDPRTVVLLACAIIYLARLSGTLFGFLHRAVSWPEAASVSGLVLVVHPLFAWLGRHGPATLDARDWTAWALYLAGSILNTGAEADRQRWKADPAHAGQLYTGGPFRWIRHPNYLGDLLLFSGYAALTRSPWAFIVPAMMLGGFVFVSVPDLDRHLSDHYGDAYAAWARRSWRLLPFVY